jgi:hypothetical protein
VAPAYAVPSQLLITIFPFFSDLHRQLHAADAEFARQCMDHFIEYVRGPPNRPTRDPNGFLAIILSFLDGLDRGEAS